MQGAAGIAAYLLRLTRVIQDGPSAPVVDRADQWWAIPPPLRTVHTPSRGSTTRDVRGTSVVPDDNIP
jgi:hypothetical protein